MPLGISGTDGGPTPANATEGDVVVVKARPNYRATIESDDLDRLTVRPLPGQQMTTRARAIWRRSILEVVSGRADNRTTKQVKYGDGSYSREVEDHSASDDLIAVPDPRGPLPAQIAYLRATVWAAMMEIENGMFDMAYHRLSSAYERTRHAE